MPTVAFINAPACAALIPHRSPFGRRLVCHIATRSLARRAWYSVFRISSHNQSSSRHGGRLAGRHGGRVAGRHRADPLRQRGSAVAVLAAGAPSSTGLRISSDTRRAAASPNGHASFLYAAFPGHFSSGLCGEDLQLAGGVVLAVAVTAAVAAEVEATAASMSRVARA